MKRFLISVFVTALAVGVGTMPMEAQEYARWYGVWDSYRGTWYGDGNTKVTLSREGGDEMMVSIVYKGVEYQDALLCISSTDGVAPFLSSDRAGALQDIVGNITISNGRLSLSLIQDQATTPFFETSLNKKRPSSNTSSNTSRSNNADAVTGLRAEVVARRFCEAMYDNNMARAKSLMTADGARRSPDTIRESREVLASYKRRLQTAKFKVIENEYTSRIVTVRFYDPAYPYLDKRGRWFGCAVELENTNGQWKVSSYGY